MGTSDETPVSLRPPNIVAKTGAKSRGERSKEKNMGSRFSVLNDETNMETEEGGLNSKGGQEGTTRTRPSREEVSPRGVQKRVKISVSHKGLAAKMMSLDGLIAEVSVQKFSVDHP